MDMAKCLFAATAESEIKVHLSINMVLPFPQIIR
uniref:Uncharacterized protein n=1 Tax=Arundo donax TaxID=35708 RepID=A0A0A9BB52_ARUDO